jgi:transposase
MTRAEDSPVAPEAPAAAPVVSPEEEIVRLRAELAARDEIIAKLLARVAELERQLGLNSSNSGKPPSSDGLRKPPRTTSLREPSGRKPGGQKGHPGGTLRQTEHPEAILDHLPAACPGCGGAFGLADSVGHQARQVFDLPDPQPLQVAEHRAHDCRCPNCGATARAAFPETVTGPVQYGSNLAAVVAYLSAVQLLPEDRIVQLLHDLHGIEVSAASVGAMTGRTAEALEAFADAVGQAGAGQACRRDRSAGRRIPALAAGGGDHPVDLLRRDVQARRDHRRHGRRAGPRPLRTLFRPPRRPARPVQRPPPARAEGTD